jgi:Lon protease-like protein
MNSAPDELSNFQGVARLFPLPDFVLFPHVVAPLHIFEPRYGQMTEDALEGDRLIALVLLKPGFEKDYEGTPPIHDMACLGHIVNEQRLNDGKLNILVRGICRLQIEKEMPTLKLYRQVTGRPHLDGTAKSPPGLRDQLAEATLPLLPPVESVAAQIKQLFDSPMSLGGLCDVLAFALPLETELRQELLEELDLNKRACRLIAALESGDVPALLPPPRELRRYPPEFSTN